MGSGLAGVGGHLPLLDRRAGSAGPVGAAGAVGLPTVGALLPAVRAVVGALDAPVIAHTRVVGSAAWLSVCSSTTTRAPSTA